nr:MAG TPA: hypothetical protein [Caudoviricetes sp.]
MVAENFNTPRQYFGGYNRRFLLSTQNSKNEVSKQAFSLVKNDSKLVSFQQYQTFHALFHNLTNTNFFPHKQHKSWFLKEQFLCYNIVRDFFS